MPVVQVRALPQPRSVDPQRVIQRLCVELSQVYGCPANQMWATWQTIEGGLYVEGEVAMKSQPHDTHPPIVNLICSEGKSPDLIERMLSRCAEVIGEELEIGGNVFVTYTEAKSGQLYMGGGIRKKK